MLPNCADNELADLAAKAKRLIALSRNQWATALGLQPLPGGVGVGGGGLTSLRPWWTEFPADGRYFDKSGVINTPSLGASLQTVFSFTSPPGWNGVIKFVSQNYTGGGFVQGAGDLLWTIRRAGAVEVEYNAKTFELGTIAEPTDTNILFGENELIEYLVSVSAAAGIPIAGTSIICRMKGWLKPR